MVDGVVIPQCFWIDKGSNVKNTLVQQKDINVNHSLWWILKISSTLGMASVPCKWEMRINFNAHFPADFQISKHGSSQDSGIKTIHRSSCFIRPPGTIPKRCGPHPVHKCSSNKLKAGSACCTKVRTFKSCEASMGKNERLKSQPRSGILRLD